MNAEARFNSIILAITSPIMFFLITITQKLRGDFDCDEKFIGLGLLLSALMTVGTYKGLAFVLIFFSRRYRFVKRFILGPAYLEGTWIGELIGKSGDSRIIVENYEQNLFDVVIRGKSFTQDGVLHATWHAHAVKIDVDSGILFCFYETIILSRSVPVYGVGKLNLNRISTPLSEPEAMAGFVTDTDNGITMPITLWKRFDELLNDGKAIEEYGKLKSLKSKASEAGECSDENKAPVESAP